MVLNPTKKEPIRSNGVESGVCSFCLRPVTDSVSFIWLATGGYGNVPSRQTDEAQPLQSFLERYMMGVFRVRSATFALQKKRRVN